MLQIGLLWSSDLPSTTVLKGLFLSAWCSTPLSLKLPTQLLIVSRWYPQWTPYPPTHFTFNSSLFHAVRFFTEKSITGGHVTMTANITLDTLFSNSFHSFTFSSSFFPCCQVLHWEIQGLEDMLQWHTICVAGSTASRCSVVSTAWSACVSGSIAVVHALCVILTVHCKMCCYYCWCWLKQTKGNLSLVPLLCLAAWCRLLRTWLGDLCWKCCVDVERQVSSAMSKSVVVTSHR